MISSSETPDRTSTMVYPAAWDLEELRRNWTDYLIAMTKDCQSPLPYKRIQWQVEQSTVYKETIRKWPELDASERLEAWKSLLKSSEQVIREVLPTCVQCGECCRKSSPTLHLEDLNLLQDQKIPWDRLLTLRSGEPAQSPFEEKPFLLPGERIKIRAKAGSQECVFLDSASDQCTIYAYRPLQCRAQACWDSTIAKELAKQKHLTRRDIFSDVELLLSMIQEHDERCSFLKLEEAFERLHETHGESIDEIIQLLAYEEHFRNFMSQKMTIPESVLDLIFGRSFSDLAPVFGFRVRREPDGTNCLIPDKAE